MGQRTVAWTKVLTEKTEKWTYWGETEEAELKNLVTGWTWGTGEKTLRFPAWAWGYMVLPSPETETQRRWGRAGRRGQVQF